MNAPGFRFRQQRVFVYWNLHKKCWSIKSTEGKYRGRVVAHSDTVVLGGCKFKVSEAGRQRVLRERRKNVHAGVEGILVSTTNNNGMWDYVGYGVPVSYNPYKGPSFYEKLSGREEAVETAARVLMTKVDEAPSVVGAGVIGPKVGQMCWRD